MAILSNSKLLMTTGTEFEGYRILKYHGVVSTEIVFRNSILKSISATFSDAINRMSLAATELSGSTELIDEAKTYLMEKFSSEVLRTSANAVLGIDFETSFGTDIIRVAMSGTPVKIERSIGTENDLEDEHILKVSHTNLTDPILLSEISLRVLPNGISSVLHLVNMEDGKVGDVKATVRFENAFGDIYEEENACFINFQKSNTPNMYYSNPFFFEIPKHILCCVQSCDVIINKYYYDDILSESQSLELVAVEGIELPENIREIVLERLQEMKNAQEVLDYLDNNKTKFSPDVYQKILGGVLEQKRLEGVYGPDMYAIKKVFLAALPE